MIAGEDFSGKSGPRHVPVNIWALAVSMKKQRLRMRGVMDLAGLHESRQCLDLDRDSYCLDTYMHHK